MYIKTEPIVEIHKKRKIVIGIESPRDELLIRHLLQKVLNKTEDGFTVLTQEEKQICTELLAEVIEGGR